MDLEMPVLYVTRHCGVNRYFLKPLCRDGFAATREIRKKEAMGILKTRSFIIALTGNARLEQVQAARDAGVDDVMIKVRQLRTSTCH